MINCFADPIIKQYIEIEELGVDTLLSNTSTVQIKQDIFEKLEEKYLKTSTDLSTAKESEIGYMAKTTGYIWILLRCSGNHEFGILFIR